MSRHTDDSGRSLDVCLGVDLERARDAGFAALARHGRLAGEVRIETPLYRGGYALGGPPVMSSRLVVRGTCGALLAILARCGEAESWCEEASRGE